MGNYASNPNVSEEKSDFANQKRMICASPSSSLSSSLLNARELSSYNQSTISQLNEFDINKLELRKTEIDENDIKIIVHSFDALMNHLLQEKIAKIESGKGQEHNSMATYKESSTKSIFDNLTEILSTHFDNYLTACKRSDIMASAYKNCSENPHTCDNESHSRHCERTFCNKELISENSLSPYYLNELITMVNKSSNSNNNNNNNSCMVENASRRTSMVNSLTNNKNMIVSQSSANINPVEANNCVTKNSKLNNLVQLDHIRLNLPEIFDQQDEITILRLLIKLLSNKVRKLNDENSYLLQQITALNDINTELASIIQHKFEK